MILKYFELNKLNFNLVNFLLFHGKNEGYKNEEIKKITKILKRTIVNYDEKQIIENTDEFFEIDNVDQIMIDQKIGVNTSLLKKEWTEIIESTINEAKLIKPSTIKMITGGRDGKHSCGFDAATTVYNDQ